MNCLTRTTSRIGLAKPLSHILLRPRIFIPVRSINMSTKNNDDFKLDRLLDVKDKVALITGAGSGIGLMAAQALAVNGAKVYMVGRREERLERAIESHEQGITGHLIPLVADITDKTEIKRLVKEIESREKNLMV